MECRFCSLSHGAWRRKPWMRQADGRHMRFVRIYPALPIASLPDCRFCPGHPGKSAACSTATTSGVRLEFHGQSSPLPEPASGPPQSRWQLSNLGRAWHLRGCAGPLAGALALEAPRASATSSIRIDIVFFEYRVDGRVCRVTFRRIFQAPPGFLVGLSAAVRPPRSCVGR